MGSTRVIETQTLPPPLSLPTSTGSGHPSLYRESFLSNISILHVAPYTHTTTMVHNDSTPFLDEPPESPWRIRMKAHNRRSPLVKRVVAFAALVAVTLPFFLLFTYVRQTPRSSSSEDVTVTLDVVPPTHGPSTMEHIPNLPVNSSMTMSNPVIFSLIMFSFDSASEGAILMKSILMYSSQPVEFHILCDEEAKTYLERRLLLVKRPRQNVVVKFYDMPLSSIRARIGREGAIASDHSAGLPGLLKLFIHEVLPETVKKSIFVDTDAFFISDPVLLWRRFDTLPPQIAVSLPTHGDQNEPEWNFASNICSCVMLLNLERLRELRLMDSSLYREDGSGVTPIGPSAFQAMYGPPGPSGHYEGVKLGDQGYWWAIVSHRPDILEHLSYDWEVSSCLVTMYGTSLGDDDISETDERARQVHTVGTAEEGHVILPKLVHFNCLNTERYHEWKGWSDPNDDLGRGWGPVVKYHAGSKWLWLNQASDHQNISLTIETIHDVKFLDERSAGVALS